MPFVTYENHRNPHFTIHREGCGQIAKRGDQHAHGQGGYETHAANDEARQYAEGTSLQIIDCSYCSPPVRILPLNRQEFPGCHNAAEIQAKFFLDELPLRQDACFW